MAPQIASVIVTYHPDANVLAQQVAALSLDGAVVVVDNTEGPASLPDHLRAHVLRNGANLGVAAALNRGVAEARRLGAEIIAVFDQDSNVECGFLNRLVQSLDPAHPGIVAAVALSEADGREYPSHRLHPLLGWRAVFGGDLRAPVAADVVISSGSAATAVTYDLAGGYDEGLFIDCVDVDWCLRCRAANVPIAIEPRARMRHSIGQGGVRIAGLGTTIVHSERRVYYKVRNPWNLARRSTCPPSLAFRLIVMSLLRELLVAIRYRTPGRTRAVRAGLLDGIKGWSGPWMDV